MMSSLCPLRTNLGAFKFSILKQTREDHLAKSFCFADCSTGKMEQFQVSTILATFVEWIPQARRRSFALLLLSSVLIFGIRTSSL